MVVAWENSPEMTPIKVQRKYTTYINLRTAYLRTYSISKQTRSTLSTGSRKPKTCTTCRNGSVRRYRNYRRVRRSKKRSSAVKRTTTGDDLGGLSSGGGVPFPRSTSAPPGSEWVV